MAVHVVPTVGELFVAFVRDARALSMMSTRPTAFAQFVSESRILLARRRELLAPLAAAWRERFGSSLPSFDLFEALGVDGVENRYTDLLASLCSKRPEWDGEAFSRALVARVRPACTVRLGSYVGAAREVTTDDGRIDLVLDFEAAAVAIETKVRSVEHLVPSGRAQSTAYPGALRRHLAGKGVPKEIVFVFLTPTGTPPIDEAGGVLNFFDVADAILETRSGNPDPDLDAVARLFAAHLVDCATYGVSGCSFRELSDALARNTCRDRWLASALMLADAMTHP